VNSGNILILGGYGNAGLPIADLLLKYTQARIVIAGRNATKAEAVACNLNAVYQGERVSEKFVDVGNPESLKISMQDTSLVIVASSTTRYTREVAGAAIAAGIDYFDIQYSVEKVKILKSIEEKIKNAGFCFITDGGFHPGLPAALIRYATQFYDTYEKANVGSLIQLNWKNISVSESTKMEFVGELLDYQGLLFKNGAWKTASMWSTRDFITMDMGEPFGKKLCTPMFFEEIRVLPRLFPSLKEAGFFMAGFNWFTDMIIMPFSFMVLKLFPKATAKSMANLLFWSLKLFSSPPYDTIMKLESSGIKDGRQKSVSVILNHEDSYMFTAIPAVSCLLQYLDGTIRNPGLWFMGDVADPDRLLNDMVRMGIRMKTNP
jgi:saccharopine dehydrogenase (NAD+, L-lysine-forming)